MDQPRPPARKPLEAMNPPNGASRIFVKARGSEPPSQFGQRSEVEQLAARADQAAQGIGPPVPGIAAVADVAARGIGRESRQDDLALARPGSTGDASGCARSTG